MAEPPLLSTGTVAVVSSRLCSATAEVPEAPLLSTGTVVDCSIPVVVAPALCEEEACDVVIGLSAGTSRMVPASCDPKRLSESHLAVLALAAAVVARACHS